MRLHLRLTALAVVSLLITTLSQSGLPTRGVFYNHAGTFRFRQIYSTSPVFADLRSQLDTIDRQRERRFMKSEVRYNDHLYDIARVGTLAQQMALTYLYTGDEDAAKLAEECVECPMRFPKWDYFLEGGTEVVGLQRAPNSALGVALTVEVLGDRLPATTVSRWLKVMAERGIEPCFRAVYGMRHPDKVKGWSMDTTSTYYFHRPLERGLDMSHWPVILNTINLKAIPASALALTALVYRDHMGETADTRRWLEQATYSIGTFGQIYARDGSYNEGISYAHYTTLHLIQAIDALQRNGVSDLTDLINWEGYQRYLLEMTQPVRQDPNAIINFSDAGGGAQASVSFWIAAHSRDGLARWFGENMAQARDIWSVIFYDTTVASTPPPAGPHLWHSDLDWIVGRTGYGIEDLVVALRSGPPFNHEHADRNGLILKCYGERLVVDPYRPPYGWRDPSWKMRLTAGHSALLIDGQGHQYVDGHEGTNASQASASIVRCGERPGCYYWTSDATHAYQLTIPDVRSVTRTVIMLTDARAVILVDKVIKESTASIINARFYAYNSDSAGSVIAEKDGFAINRPSARMVAQAASPSGVSYATGLPDIPAEVARRHPFADVSTVQKSKDACLVTVLLPLAKGSQGTASVDRHGDVYDVTVHSGDRTFTVRVLDTGAIPEFELR
jgi:hypothetical protein